VSWGQNVELVIVKLKWKNKKIIIMKHTLVCPVSKIRVIYAGNSNTKET
jgi:hypothetical protein